MDWQDILMIVIAALLFLVWLPVLFYSVHKALRNEERHSRLNQESQKENIE